TPLSVRPALCIVTVSPVTSNTARSTDACTDGPWSWRCRPMNGPPSNSRVRAKRVTIQASRHCEPPQASRQPGAGVRMAPDCFASLPMTNGETSPQHRPHRDGLAAQELVGCHRGFAGTLDGQQSDRRIPARQGEFLVKHRSRGAVYADYPRLEHLDPLAVELEPGAGERGEGADFAFDELGGPGPVDPALGLVDLGRISRAELGLRLGFELVELGQRIDHQPGADLRQLGVEFAAGLVLDRHSRGGQ